MEVCHTVSLLAFFCGGRAEGFQKGWMFGCFFPVGGEVSEEFFVLCWENLAKILKLQFEVKMILDIL